MNWSALTRQLVAVVAASLLAAGCGGSSAESGNGEVALGCTLTTHAAEVIASALHKESVAELLHSAGVGLDKGCELLVETLRERPSETVSFTLATSSETLPESMSGYEFTAPAVQPTSTPGIDIDIDRIIACVQSYDVEFLVDLCTDHTIEP